MNFLLEDDQSLGFPQVGDLREGQVVAHRKHEILIDISAKSEGIITSSEIDNLDGDVLDLLAVGNQVTVYVVNPDDQNGNIILSYRKAMEKEDWEMVQNLLDTEEIYKGKVVGSNRGGLLVNVGLLRGFVPTSHLIPTRLGGGPRSENEERLRSNIGDEISTKVIEVDQSRNRLILSERAAMREVRAVQLGRLLEELEEGDIRDGRVVNIADFGAFVDIGGAEGLVHLSELSWKRVNHPTQVINIGDDCKVYVLNIDKERNRIALSLKRLEPDPWTKIDENYEEGDLLEATITKLTKFGAFARVNDEFELEGLIHISELSNEHVEDPHDIVSRGEVVSVRVIRVDRDRRQLGLSMKQVTSVRYLESDLARAEELAPDEEVAAPEDLVAPEDLAMAEDSAPDEEEAAPDEELALAKDSAPDEELALAEDPSN
jgi:small subunit ribosomal protein S1